MKYGVNNATKVFCKKHQEFHNANELCRWCPVEPIYPKHVSLPGADADCYLCGGAGERWFVNGYGDHVCETCSCVGAYP